MPILALQYKEAFLFVATLSEYICTVDIKKHLGFTKEKCIKGLPKRVNKMEFGDLEME